MQYRQHIPHPIPFFLKSCPVPYIHFGVFNFILCNCSFGEPSFQRFWKRKSDVACGSVSTMFDTCVPMSLEFFCCQSPSSQSNTCSGGFLGVATLLKTVLQEMYHWMIHCPCVLLGCQSVVSQFLTCFIVLMCLFLFHTCNEFRGSQWDALASVCTQWQCDTQGWQWLRKEVWDVYLIECSLKLWVDHEEATVVTAQALRFGGVARRRGGRVHGYSSASP